METEAAILWERPGEWSVEPIELDPPKDGEVLVRLTASGMCHSDEHLVTGDMPVPLPMIGGHEGAGVIEEVGPGVTALAPGDHVVLGFVPACGKCPSCATGHSNLCDVGGVLMTGRQMDGTLRHHARGRDIATMVCLGTFAPYTVVNQASCVKILEDIPLDKACLVGCGVTTGWGSAVYAADVRPGDYVAVIGIGGIGASAVQGARLAGAEMIFAIDPVELKRTLAPSFGATHTSPSVEEAFELIQRETWGRMCDKVICAMGIGKGSMMVRYMRFIVTSDSIIGWMLVTTTRPRVAVMSRIDCIIAPEPTPMAQMTLSHMWPQVSCPISAAASSTEGDTWVAPNEGASVRLSSTGSMAKIISAPARRAPCRADAPMPPTPMTATLSPGRLSAA